MTLVADGSRILDSNRNPLGAIDESVVLSSRFLPIIYAGGVDLAAGDSWLNATGTYEWYWRIEGGTFAKLGDSTPADQISDNLVATDTVLVSFTAVTNANKKTNQTATSTVSLSEHEGTGGSQPSVDLTGEVSSESQVALNVRNAIPGKAYEMRLECVHSAGTTNIDYPAKIIIPIFPTDYASFPKPKLRR